MTWAPDIVIYHDPCLDGFTAAWAAWQRWPDAEFIGSNYGKLAPDVAGKHVLIVDFSYKRAGLDALAQDAASIVILDHHKSARDELEPFTFTESEPGLIKPEAISGMLRDLSELNAPPVIAIFDMDRSGARMTWDFATRDSGKPVPWIVQLVEDRDLWLFIHGDTTRDFGVRLSIAPKDFRTWDRMAMELDSSLRHQVAGPVEDGRAMRIYRDWLAEEIAARAEVQDFAGYRVPMVDCPHELGSEVGDRLCRIHHDRPFAVMRTHKLDGTSYSLRSRGDFDVSEVAVRFGGGGHAGAAGFRVPTTRPSENEA